MLLEGNNIFAFDLVVLLEDWILVEVHQIMPVEFTRFMFEIILWYFHEDSIFVLETFERFLVNGSIFDAVLESVEQQLTRVLRSLLVLFEFLPELSCNGEFLGLQEAIEEHLYGAVNIVGGHIIA